MVAVESILTTLVSMRRFVQGLFLLALVFILLAPPASSGAWTVWDLGPDYRGGTMLDDREGGIWMKVSDTEILHLLPDGQFLSLPGPGVTTSRFYLRASQRDGGLVALAEKVGDYRFSIWEYSDGSWRKILDARDSPHPDSDEGVSPKGLLWASVTTDDRWSCVSRWEYGGSTPGYSTGIANRIDGEWIIVDFMYTDFYWGFFAPANDGATWHENGGITRVNWGGGEKSLDWTRGYVTTTWRGSFICSFTEYTEPPVLKIAERSFARGQLWEAETRPLEAWTLRPFGREVYVVMEDGAIHRMFPSDDLWAVEPLTQLPAELSAENIKNVITDAAGRIWVYAKGYYIAVYDRGDELIDPTITLTVGLDVIEPQDTTVVNASIAPGQRTYNADIYAVVETPSGELWSYPWNEPGIHPLAGNLHFDPHTFVSDFILLHIEPPMPFAFGQDGEYTVYVALTEPSTLNPIGEIAYVPFELRLAQ